MLGLRQVLSSLTLTGWALLCCLLLQTSTSFPIPTARYHFSPCSQLIYDHDGYVDMDAIMFNCSQNIPSRLFPPSYFADLDGVFHPTNVSIQVALNNIIHVDDLTSQFTMDFFFRVVWNDPRLILPDLWKHVNPQALTEGIEISKLFLLQDELRLWRPDIFFYQSTEMNVINHLVKLLPNGTMFWARQMIVTFSNPQMPFHHFPLDTQNFSITLESFTYDTRLIQLQFVDNEAISLLTDVQQGNQPLVANNQLWKYDEYSSFIIETSAPSPTNPQRAYSTAFINLKFRRQSNGVIFRLALPVIIFLIIVGTSFWSNENERIEVTLQIILVVAALYIIIGQSIPFVGYLTRMDLFIIVVFAILALTITIHFLTTMFTRKAHKYPMDSFYRDAMVIVFRGFWMPMSIAIFIGFFGYVNIAFLAIIGIFSIGCLFYFKGKSKLLIRSYYLSLLRLKIKSDLVYLGAIDEKTELPMKLTWLERWILYLAQAIQRDKNMQIRDLFVKYKPNLLDPTASAVSSANAGAPSIPNLTGNIPSAAHRVASTHSIVSNSNVLRRRHASRYSVGSSYSDIPPPGTVVRKKNRKSSQNLIASEEAAKLSVRGGYSAENGVIQGGPKISGGVGGGSSGNMRAPRKISGFPSMDAKEMLRRGIMSASQYSLNISVDGKPVKNLDAKKKKKSVEVLPPQLVQPPQPPQPPSQTGATFELTKSSSSNEHKYPTTLAASSSHHHHASSQQPFPPLPPGFVTSNTAAKKSHSVSSKASDSSSRDSKASRGSRGSRSSHGSKGSRGSSSGPSHLSPHQRSASQNSADVPVRASGPVLAELTKESIYNLQEELQKQGVAIEYDNPQQKVTRSLLAADSKDDEPPSLENDIEKQQPFPTEMYAPIQNNSPVHASPSMYQLDENYVSSEEDDEDSEDEDDYQVHERNDNMDHDDEEALMAFKRTIATQMGAVFKKKESALQFIATDNYRMPNKAAASGYNKKRSFFF